MKLQGRTVTDSYKYECRDGRSVSIEIDDDTYEAIAYTVDGREIGRLRFREISDDNGCYLKLVWAYLDKLADYKGQGIGRECLRVVRDRYSLPITAEDHDGIRQDDGSHLTGDAPGFVAKMREEGLIENS
jgi:GNAT superfamily N-acetyltransferase